jgi:hypothetical protein
MDKPQIKPKNPNFGSGPTTKHLGWSLSSLEGAALGRSHRSTLGKKKLAKVVSGMIVICLIFTFFFSFFFLLSFFPLSDFLLRPLKTHIVFSDFLMTIV